MLLFASVLLSGCASRQPLVIDSACTSFKQIFLTEQDIATMSAPALASIIAHNETWAARCE